MTKSQHHALLEQKYSQTRHTNVVRSLCIWNEQLVSASSDNSIIIWKKDFSKGPKRFLTGHTNVVTSLLVWKNQLVSASWDSTIRIWSSKTFLCARVLKGHVSYIIGMCLWKINDYEFLVSAGVDKSIIVWNVDFNSCRLLNFGTEKTVLLGHTNFVRCVLPVTTKNGENQLWSGAEDGTIRIWNTKGITEYELRDFGKINLLLQKKDFVFAASFREVFMISIASKTVVSTTTHAHVDALIPFHDFILVGGRQLELLYKKNKIPLIENHTQDVRSLLFHNTNLWIGFQKGEVIMFQERLSEIVRVLWVGWKKHTPDECHLAKLPKDIMKDVVLLVCMNYPACQVENAPKGKMPL